LAAITVSGGFLADLLQDGVVALGEQLGGIGGGGIAAVGRLARFDHVGQPVKNGAHLPAL